ncbi:BrnA antitoxin family protein [Arenimonas metalli]|nr:BrnA antitoxin family protein [Arenimonas metalli]
MKKSVEDSGMRHDFERARRGAVLPSPGKTRVTMFLDNDVLAQFRATATRNGRGYQTEINAFLRKALTGQAAPNTDAPAKATGGQRLVGVAGAAARRKTSKGE